MIVVSKRLGFALRLETLENKWRKRDGADEIDKPALLRFRKKTVLVAESRYRDPGFGFKQRHRPDIENPMPADQLKPVTLSTGFRHAFAAQPIHIAVVAGFVGIKDLRSVVFLDQQIWRFVAIEHQLDV